ncbi:Kunitz-type protease inhibitor 4 [Paragonimus heterotremus]|uniref:Kunitz-type protease inhibitor 4 n=1 Tax=Paragonimus heterotremus TaxID=100268 RepID=A0A8J4SVI9_9TREM|nr:Kunitz-type protease inhibitor 4 [Paragonimus heterotremus]
MSPENENLLDVDKPVHRRSTVRIKRLPRNRTVWTACLVGFGILTFVLMLLGASYILRLYSGDDLPERNPDCNLPLERGNCSESFERWAWDANQCTCLQFHFTGCNGNKNQFKNKKECEESCHTRPCIHI